MKQAGIILILIFCLKFAENNKDIVEAKDSPGYQDVLPVFVSRCSMCHNGSTPERNWLDYKTAFKKKDQIKLRLQNRSMPPYGMPMLDSERKLMIDWVKAGGKK